MADERQSCILVPCGDEGLPGEVTSEALVPVLLAVRCAVVGSGAGDLRVEFAGAVPRAPLRGDTCRESAVALVAEPSDNVTCLSSPVRFLAVFLIVLTAPVQTVTKDVGGMHCRFPRNLAERAPSAGSRRGRPG